MGTISWETQIGQILYQEGKKKNNSDLFDGMSLNEMLIFEANRLKNIIQKHIDSYYASYSPKVYKRLNNFKKSLRVESKVVDKSIAVYFDEDYAWAPSYITGDEPWGFVPILLDTGWYWHNAVNMKGIAYRFVYYEGSNYLQDAIKEFADTDKYGVGISIEINPSANPEFSNGFMLSAYAKDVYDNM